MRRAAEMRVLRQEICRLDIAVGEIAAPAAGNTDLLAEFVIVLDQQNATAALPGLRGAHHACRTGADHDDIERATAHSLIVSV